MDGTGALSDEEFSTGHRGVSVHALAGAQLRRISPLVPRESRDLEATDAAVGTAPLQPPILARERVQRRSLAAADALAALAAVGGAALLTQRAVTAWALLIVPVVVVIAKLQGLYDRDELVLRKSTLREVPGVLQLATVTGVIAFFGRAGLAAAPSDGMALYFLIAFLLAVFMLAGRLAARRIARGLVPPERCLGVGDLPVLIGLHERMAGMSGTKMVATIRTEELPTKQSELHDFAAELNIHRIIIAPDRQTLDTQTADLISAGRSAGLRVSLLPGCMAPFGVGAAVDQVGGHTVVGMPHFGLSRSSTAIKRAFDFAFATVAVVAVAPFMLGVAIWIKLDSVGPVLFRQTRVGQDGRRFAIWKFRSMVDGADAMKSELQHLNEAGEGMFKIPGDPRVTRSGQWLRRTRMDELPQLFNVLRGEMSLVGPRPLIVEEDARIVGRDRHRLHLRPGMTGPWQCLGSNSLLLPIAEMASLDYMYTANWSLWEDIFIMLKTVGLLFADTGN